MFIHPIYNCWHLLIPNWASLVAQTVKNLPAVQETWSLIFIGCGLHRLLCAELNRFIVYETHPISGVFFLLLF